MIVEWEVTLKCNYRCFYCTNLDPAILPSEKSLESFIKMLGKEYPGIEIFVFGGEPFLHSKISLIIQTFNKYNIPFVIQTNFSKKSLKVMNSISESFNINISVHPTEVSLNNILKNLSSLNSNILIKNIDVMYTNKEAIEYYMRIKKYGNTYLTPIADFGDGISTKILEEYNELRHNKVWNSIIQFEQVEKLGKLRSDLWETYNPKGKPCLYNNKYFLYGPNLELYNCCYRTKHKGVCEHDKCFLM